MKLDRYLVIGYRRGSKPSARLTVQRPALESHEIAVQLQLDVPEALFTRPQLSAAIVIPSDAIAPAEIGVDTAVNICDLVKRELGIDLRVTIPAHGDADA